MMDSSLFVLCQNYFSFLEIHCFVSTGILLTDVSHLEDLISTSVYHLEEKISNITLMHSNWCCMWLIYTNHAIRSWNLMFLLELLHLSDQVYKYIQRNFVLLYVIVKRVKVSVAVLTKLFLLPEDIQKTEVFIQISISKNSNRGRLGSCEDIIFVIWSDTWRLNHTIKRKFLCTWLVKLTRLLIRN